MFLPVALHAAEPNIVLIVADDLGGTFAGQGVPTPNIAALGRAGAVFILNAPASGEAMAELILDGAARRVDPARPTAAA